MEDKFTQLFSNNTSLNSGDKRKLVAASKGKLVFDPVFEPEQVTPQQIRELLNNYGWFWVSIDSDPSNARQQHAVVVNDISKDDDPSKAVISYYDVADGNIHEKGFQDFVKWVHDGALTSIQRSEAVVRLSEKPEKNTPPSSNGSFKNLSTDEKHEILVASMKRFLLDNAENPNICEIGYKLEESSLTGIELTVNTLNGQAMDIPSNLEIQWGEGQSMMVAINQSIPPDYMLAKNDPAPSPPPPPPPPPAWLCSYQPNELIKNNLHHVERPLTGGRYICNMINSMGGTAGGWFRDLNTQRAVILSNEHVLEAPGSRRFVFKKLPNGQTDSEHVLTTLRITNQSIPLLNDSAIAEPSDDTWIPARMQNTGSPVQWGNTIYYTGPIANAIPDTQVLKVGSTTGLTFGRIVTFFLLLGRDMNDPHIVRNNFAVRFEVIGEDGFCCKGDSGSLILRRDAGQNGRHDVIGLLYGAGNKEHANGMDRSGLCLGMDHVCRLLQIAPY